MRFAGIVLLLCFAVKALASERPLDTLSKTTSCAEKKFCLVIYAAPWCPTCKALMGSLVHWSTSTKNMKVLGVKIVVGQEKEPGQNKEMADKFGASGVIDQDGSIYQKLPGKGFPQAYLMKDEKILKFGQDAIQWAKDNLERKK